MFEKEKVNESKRKQVELKAIKFVMDYERKQGRNPKDVSKTGCGYDIKSNNRYIEVKGSSLNKPSFVQFNQYNFKALQKENNFYLYIILGINDKPKSDKPKAIIFNKNEILKKAIFYYYWEIRLKKADFEKAKKKLNHRR